MNSAAGYIGSKGGAGVFHAILRETPRHETYVEAFAGRAAVFRHKSPAANSILIDRDPDACRWLRKHCRGAAVLCGAAERILTTLPAVKLRATLVYLDPPYLLESRRMRRYYRWEMSLRGHGRLLALCRKLPCMVMISGYESPLYAAELHDWRKVEFWAMTRGGPRRECLWCNFPKPQILHDPRYAGEGFRERERMKKKKNRWAQRFAAMGRPERQLIASALPMVDAEAVAAAIGDVRGGNSCPAS